METQLCVLFFSLKYILQFSKHFNKVFVTVYVYVFVRVCVECVRACGVRVCHESGWIPKARVNTWYPT